MEAHSHTRFFCCQSRFFPRCLTLSKYIAKSLAVHENGHLLYSIVLCITIQSAHISSFPSACVGNPVECLGKGYGHIVIHIAKSPFISIAYKPNKVKKEAVAIVKNLAVLESKLIRRWSLLTVVSSFPHGASGNPVQASRAKHANEK